MNAVLLPEWDGLETPVVGMLHLLPLPGAPKFGGSFAAVRDRMLADADALAEGGVDGLLLENFGDAPFMPDRVPASVVADMTVLGLAVRERIALPFGINCLRNDGLSALAVARAAGADFIRVNVLCGARVTDQGVVEGIAHELLRERRALGAGAIRILADVDVKHSAPLGASRPIPEEVDDTLHRGLADAVIVSGPGTGSAPDTAALVQARGAAGGFPVWIGSGVTPDNAGALAALCDGMIVGTALKSAGDVTAPVDRARVKDLLNRLR